MTSSAVKLHAANDFKLLSVYTSMMERPSWLEISEEAIASNIALLNGALKGPMRLGHVIKADGYGLGGSTLLKVSQRCGVTDFFVFSADQAMAVRQQLNKTSRLVVLLASWQV